MERVANRRGTTSLGMRLLIADQGWRSRVRKSTACVVRQARERTPRNQCRALSTQPIVGENSIGMRLAWFIPCRDQAAGILEHLSLARTLRGRFLRGGRGALHFHLAFVESHNVDFAAVRRGSSSGRAARLRSPGRQLREAATAGARVSVDTSPPSRARR